ncbi:MAG: hypothetical protein QOC96_3388 [Acidobacteriota bacterium]|jgi:hypothetical protein|nr:hypothetical protein [Acidobacteriota bacterium]
MRKHNLTIYVLAVAIIFAAAIIIINIHAAMAQKTQAQDRTNDERQEVKEALRRGGYREVARIKRHYVGNIDPHWDWSSFSIEGLTKNSAAVVVGIPVRSKSQLSSNGLSVVTEYEVTVQEVIKGKISQGDTIKVSLLGGKVDFEDGTSVELNTPDFERMANYNSYVLFLTATPDGSGAFKLTGGPQGLFELPSDGTSVKPHGRTIDPAVKEAKDKSIQSFLENVRSQATKWPEPGKCCN